MNQVTEIFRRRPAWGFILYDFGNSAYVLVFNAFLFPIFVRESVFPDSSSADLYWGLSLSTSLAVALLLSPIIGFVADKSNRRLVFGVSVTCVMIGCLCLVLLPTENAPIYMGAFVFTNLAYVISLSLYDSFISHIGTKSGRPFLSGFAWGFGYLGGVACLGIIALFQGGSLYASRTALLVTSVFYALFATLSLYFLPATEGAESQRNFRSTVRLFSQRSLLQLLASFWLINEAIDVVIYFTSLYATSTLKLSSNVIGAFLLLTQLIGFPATAFLAYLATKRGERRVINVTLCLWVVVVIIIVLSKSVVHFAILSLITAFVIGSTQSLMRSYFANQLPDDVSGFSFGVYSLVSRVTSLIGPILFGTVSFWAGSQRVAMLSVILFLVAGAVLFTMYTPDREELVDADQST